MNPDDDDAIAPPPGPPPFLTQADAVYLMRQGHLDITLPPHLQQQYDLLFTHCDTFFHLPDAQKSASYPNTALVQVEQGYVHLPHEKQYITLHHLYAPLPGSPDASSPDQVLNASISAVWRDTVTLMTRILGDISTHLGISPTAWDPLVEGSRELPITKETWSRSLMRLFRYEPTTGVADPHRDLGLLTLCVCRGRGLQVWDQDVLMAASRDTESDKGKGKAGEVPAQDDHERFWKDAGRAAILAGDTLRVLSGNRIPAGLHRVVGTETVRDSIVFALRPSTRGAIQLGDFGGVGTVGARELWQGISHRRVNVNLKEEERERLRGRLKETRESEAIA